MSKPDNKSPSSSIKQGSLDEALEALTKGLEQLDLSGEYGKDIRQDQLDLFNGSLKTNKNLKVLLLGKNDKLDGLQDIYLEEILNNLKYNQGINKIDLSGFFLKGKKEQSLKDLFAINQTIDHLNIVQTGVRFETLKQILEANKTLTKIELTVITKDDIDAFKLVYGGVDEEQNKILSQLLENNCAREFVRKYSDGDSEIQLSEGAKEWLEKNGQEYAASKAKSLIEEDQLKAKDNKDNPKLVAKPQSAIKPSASASTSLNNNAAKDKDCVIN